MQGRVYTCSHLLPDRIVSTSLFLTFTSGVFSDGGTGLIGDLDGANIASPDHHSEMRHQYHVWQERLDGMDFVGFEHYRRIFFFDPLGAARLRSHHSGLSEVACAFAADEGCIGLRLDGDAFGAYLDLRRRYDPEMQAFVGRLMTDNDIITQRPHNHRIDQQFISCHSEPLWDVFVETVKKTGFYARTWQMIDFALRSTAYCNMYVMRTELFVEYMEFWWECMLGLRARIEPAPRLYGYFAERLINLFIYGKRMQDPGLRVRFLPFVIDGARA